MPLPGSPSVLGEMGGNSVGNALERDDTEEVGEHFLMHMAEESLT